MSDANPNALPLELVKNGLLVKILGTDKVGTVVGHAFIEDPDNTGEIHSKIVCLVLLDRKSREYVKSGQLMISTIVVVPDLLQVI